MGKKKPQWKSAKSASFLKAKENKEKIKIRNMEAAQQFFGLLEDFCRRVGIKIEKVRISASSHSRYYRLFKNSRRCVVRVSDHAQVQRSGFLRINGFDFDFYPGAPESETTLEDFFDFFNLLKD